MTNAETRSEKLMFKINVNKAGVINDPLSQTHSSVSSDHCLCLNIVLFCEILKSGDGRTFVRK